MQTAAELSEIFTIPGCLTFDEPHPGMPCAHITTAVCTAELYLQGAHLTQWQPAGQEPVLFLSGRSAFTPGKAIRGGIPVIFPWFGAPDTSPVHPPAGSSSHGYARIWPWTLRFAALAGDDLHLSLTLDHNARLHALGFDFLQLGIDIMLGRNLSVRLTAANAGAVPFLFEEALHAYLNLSQIDQVSIQGLQETEFLDKTDGFQRKKQTDPVLTFSTETDRPYLNTSSPVSLTDPVLKRRLLLTKTNSQTTVIWNPAAALTARLPDLAPGDWQHFACMETANAAENAVTLQPGEAHTMSMHLSVDPL
ncbi:MAG TPA: D-hexose-6-phosphate mutarotase [Acidobacteriaceae bacterium]|nr:D-hexose-6-phosphate mutarotase [Acidobacteriaceae bacterium]